VRFSPLQEEELLGLAVKENVTLTPDPDDERPTKT
jgi:hypothetical protein